MSNEKFNMLYDFPEVAYKNDYTVVTYLVVAATKNVEAFAMALADEQTTGTWTAVSGETEELKRRFGARVVSVFPIPGNTEAEIAAPETSYIIQLAFPPDNFGADIPMIFSTLLGNISSAGKVRMLDIAFPESYVKQFTGPKFGTQGIRDILGVQGRPLLNAMIKPNIGWTPQQGRDIFYAAAKGGCDIIKDDELMPADRFHCPLVERVKLFKEAADQVYQETGEKTLHAVNITDDVSRLKDNAYRAIDAGASSLMINFYTVGFSASRMITEDPNIQVPVLAHVDFAGAMVSSPYYGVDAPLMVGKLARLAGGDFAIMGTPYGKFPLGMRDYLRTAHNMSQPWFNIKPMMMACSGGTTQAIVPQCIKELGSDIILAAGGAVHGHRMGSEAGARSMRQAIDASMAGIPLAEYAKDHEELAVALDMWGGEKKNFELMK
ncbi:MAG: RuBisCO large subunit C-terminal-like domain-containing protein [Oscillospiraceae bacterium]